MKTTFLLEIDTATFGELGFAILLIVPILLIIAFIQLLAGKREEPKKILIGAGICILISAGLCGIT